MQSTSRPIPWLRHLLPVGTLCLMGGICIGQYSTTLLWIVIGTVLAVPAAILLRGRLRLLGIALCCMCLGAVAGYHAWHPALPEEGMVQITGVVAESIRPGTRTQYRTVLRDVTLDGRPCHSGAYWSFYTAELPDGLEPGSRISVTASLYHPTGAQNPGGYDFRAYLAQNGIQIGVYGLGELQILPDGFSLYGLAARVREALSARLIETLGEDAGALVSALLLGARYLLPEEDTAAFNQLGIGHLLSVSGFHVAVLAFLLQQVLEKLLRLRRPVRLVVTAFILGFYALLTGLHPPIVRAVLLVLLMDYGRLRARQRSGLHLLCASASIALLVNPTQLASASFQLSYGAMLGLTLVQPTLRRMIPVHGAATEKLRNAFTAALSVQIGTLLPQLYWYHQIPLIGLVLNVFVLGAASVALSVCWAFLAVMYIPWLGPTLGGMLGTAMNALSGGIRALSEIPFDVLWTPQANLLTAVGWLAVLAALSALLPHIRFRAAHRAALLAAGMVLMALSLIPLPHTGADYIQLAVGSADAAVLQAEDQVIVIDTGEDGHTLATWLHQRRLSIDMLIISHLHADHAGGIEALLTQKIPVRVCCLSGAAEQADVPDALRALVERLRQSGTEIRYVDKGDVLPLPDGEMEVTWPLAAAVRPGQDANASSLTLRIVVEGVTLLTTGDLDGTYENYAAVPADILKVAHHGSKASTGAAFLAAVQPQTLLVSSGDAVRLASIRERAEGLPVWGTQESGALLIHFDNGTYSIQPFLSGR